MEDASEHDHLHVIRFENVPGNAGLCLSQCDIFLEATASPPIESLSLSLEEDLNRSFATEHCVELVQYHTDLSHLLKKAKSEKIRCLKRYIERTSGEYIKIFRTK